MKAKTNKKKITKQLAIVKSKGGRPRKNKRGQVLDPKTNKFRTGRPTAMTKDCINKLETAFGYGCTDEEACAFAGITPATLYNYQNENPDFLERKDGLKQMPNLQARKVVVEGMKSDPSIGQWWLEKKLPAEFGKGGGTTVAVQVNNVIGNKKHEYGI